MGDQCPLALSSTSSSVITYIPSYSLGEITLTSSNKSLQSKQLSESQQVVSLRAQGVLPNLSMPQLRIAPMVVIQVIAKYLCTQAHYHSDYSKTSASENGGGNSDIMTTSVR